MTFKIYKGAKTNIQRSRSVVKFIVICWSYINWTTTKRNKSLKVQNRRIIELNNSFYYRQKWVSRSELYDDIAVILPHIIDLLGETKNYPHLTIQEFQEFKIVLMLSSGDFSATECSLLHSVVYTYHKYRHCIGYLSCLLQGLGEVKW